MRELEFLPAWYPGLQRRRRALVLQAWGTGALLLVLGAYTGAQRWQVRAARQVAAEYREQIVASRQQLGRLTDSLRRQEQLRRQDRIVADLGVGVDATRLVSAVEQAMTSDMALTELTLETSDQVRPMVPRAGGPVPADAGGLDHRLTVHLSGIAPTDVEAATLLARLNDVPLFQNVALGYLRERRTVDGHVLREFGLTFDVDLNAPAEASAQ